MTRDSGFKRHVRDRARRTGESYSTARAHMRRRSEEVDAELVTRSAAPMVGRMHDRDPAVRKAVVPNLNRDQGTLIAFWMLFAHSEDGMTGLCRVHPHRVIDPDFWTLLETGLREDDALLRILARLRKQVAIASEHVADYSFLDRLDPAVMRELDTEFAAAMPGALHRMADHIRRHPDRFSVAEVPAQ